MPVQKNVCVDAPSVNLPTQTRVHKIFVGDIGEWQEVDANIRIVRYLGKLVLF